MPAWRRWPEVQSSLLAPVHPRDSQVEAVRLSILNSARTTSLIDRPQVTFPAYLVLTRLDEPAIIGGHRPDHLDPIIGLLHSQMHGHHARRRQPATTSPS